MQTYARPNLIIYYNVIEDSVHITSICSRFKFMKTKIQTKTVLKHNFKFHSYPPPPKKKKKKKQQQQKTNKNNPKIKTKQKQKQTKKHNKKP